MADDKPDGEFTERLPDVRLREGDTVKLKRKFAADLRRQDGSGWEIDHYGTDRVRVKAPSSGGPFNVRVAVTPG